MLLGRLRQTAYVDRQEPWGQAVGSGEASPMWLAAGANSSLCVFVFFVLAKHYLMISMICISLFVNASTYVCA